MLVKSVQFDELGKRFRLENGRRIQTHRFACLGPGDDVVYRSSTDAHVCCQNGNARLLPLYKATDRVEVGQRSVALTVKEIETEDELRGYNQLAQYHYRGKNLHGRRTPLILVCHDPLLPSVLGYVELSTAFLMNKPRAALLNATWTDPKSGIGWTGWSKETVRKYTNLIVRIARTVVSPEFRGLGLASLLVRHAAAYAREHWNVGGLKPLFLEITADMLRYVPFVERAGMHYVGLTEGNLERLTKDMSYILRNLDRVRRREILNEESAGIVDLQVSYAMLLNKMAKRNKLGRKSLLDLLLHDPHRLPDRDWTMLHKVFRLPKPTFLMGLTPAAEAFVTKRVERGRTGRVRGCVSCVVLQTGFDDAGLSRCAKQVDLITDTAYDTMGNIASVSNPYNVGDTPVYTSMTYDALGRKIGQHNVDGSAKSWTYSGASVTATDESLISHINTLNAVGSLVKVLEPDPATGVPSIETNYGYDSSGNLVSVVQHGVSGEAARTRGFVYDSLSRLVSASNPEAGTISYVYDANGNMLSETSPQPNIPYDPVGGQPSVQPSVTIGYCYDALNRATYKFYSAPPPSPCSNPTGAVAAYTYDTSSIAGASNTSGRLTGEAILNGGSVISSITYPVYDPVGRLLSEQQCPLLPCATPYTLNYSYDLVGNLRSSSNGLPNTDPHSLATIYQYDSVGRLNTLTASFAGAAPKTLFHAGGIGSASGYGPAGLLNAQVGVNSNGVALTMTRGYDTQMRLTSEAVTGHMITSSATSSVGSISVSGTEQSLLPATHGTATIQIVPHTLAYQVWVARPGQLGQTFLQLPRASPVELEIDGFTATLPTGNYTTTSATASALAAAINVAGSPVTATVSNSAVTVTSVATGAGSNYSYSLASGDEDFGCTSGIALALGGGADPVALPDVGNVSISITNGNTRVNTAPVSWGSGSTSSSIAAALVAAIQATVGAPVSATSSGSTVILLATTAGADANGYHLILNVTDNTTQYTSPSFTFTATGMTGGTDALTQVAPVYDYDLSGHFSPNGVITGYTDSVMGTWTFGYDKLNRLLAANGPTQQQALYQYDSFGNKWVGGMGQVAAPAVYPTANNQPAAWTHQGFDIAGNLTVMPPTFGAPHVFTYDYEHRITALETGAGYLYDAEGRRVAKGTWSNSVFTPTSEYLYGLDDHPITELRVSASGTVTWAHSNIYVEGRLLGTYDLGGLHYHLQDWLGTNRVQTSAVGVIEQQCLSLPFGENNTCTASDINNQHFTGQELDSESGLNYFQTRYQSPDTGRFLSPDTTGLMFADLSNPQSLNLYAYVGNNPLGFEDPDGTHKDCNTVSVDLANEDGTIIYSDTTVTCAEVPDPVPPPDPEADPGGGGQSEQPAVSLFQQLWNNYPSHALYPTDPKMSGSIWDLVGGEAKRHQGANVNTCAVRMCYAFNKSGMIIPPTAPGKKWRGKNNQEYIRALANLRPFFTSKFGKPQTYAVGEWKQNVAGATGIVTFNFTCANSFCTGHTELWNGSRVHDDDYTLIMNGKGTVSFWPVR